MKWILALLFTPIVALAQLPPPQATLELDWEPVASAAAYEVRLEPKEGGEPILIKATENNISQRVPVGEYSVRIRSQDKVSGYYGKWSAPIDIEVSSKVIQLLQPEDNAVLPNISGEEVEIEFRWEPNADARMYSVRIWSDNEAEAQEFPTNEPFLKTKLAPGRIYHWHVTFETNKAVKYQADPLTYSFSLLGKRLLRPEVSPKIETQKGHTIINWSQSPNAQNYKYKLSQRYLDETEWRPFTNSEGAANTWKLNRLKPSAYKVEVIATAELRMDSEVGEYEFVVKPTEQELDKALQPALKLVHPAKKKKP